METITHDGKVFTKATALAKKHRYTTDYIGQLCRGGKVESKLIGRAWFVNEEALLQHKSERYSAVRPNEIIINNRVFSDRKETKEDRVNVMPVLSKTTHRSMRFDPHFSQLSVKAGTPPVRISTYETDVSDLEPNTPAKNVPVIKPIVPKMLVIKPEIAQNIPISLSEKAKHELSFEPLPAVFLQGKLAVESLDDPDLYEDTEPVSASDIIFSPKTIAATDSFAQQTAESQLKAVQAKLHRDQTLSVRLSSEIKSEIHVSNSLPKRVENLTVPEVKPKVSFIAVPMFVIVALMLCVGLFGLSSFAESDGLEFRQSLKFNLASVSEVFEKLPQSY